MSTRLTYHGAASFEIVSPTHTILVDPFLTDNPLAPCGPDDLRVPDVILVSHAAVDHYGDAPAVAKRTGAPVICDAAVRAKLIDDGVEPDQVTATTWGIVVEVAGLLIRPSVPPLVDGNTLGRANRRRQPDGIHRRDRAGHTGLPLWRHVRFDMRLIGELYRPTVGLLGCTLPRELSHLIPGPGRFVTGEMDPDEAARAAEMLGLELAVACHYLAPNEDVDRFLELVSHHDTGGRRRVVAPLVGETLVVEPGNHWIEQKGG